MKFSNLVILASAILAAPICSFANAATRYEITITNGGSMPISPTAIYVKNGQSGNARLGEAPSSGFVQLCQTGNPSGRIAELNADKDISFVTQTTAPILPGESRVVEIEVHNPLQQSVHFETMYGKTKDVCGVGSVGSHSLYALKQHVTSEYIGKDNVLATGAFLAPALPAAHALDPNLCASASDAVSCLRELALPVSGKAQIHFFAPYLPSLVDFLEIKYGAADVQSLNIPSSGTIQFKLKLKH